MRVLNIAQLILSADRRRRGRGQAKRKDGTLEGQREFYTNTAGDSAKWESKGGQGVNSNGC